MLKRNYFTNHLVYQIFGSFMVTIITILAIAFALPTFDARLFNKIEEDQLKLLQQEVYYSQNKYNFDELFFRNLSITSVSNLSIVLVEPETHQISGIHENQINKIQAFMLKANNPMHPLQRRFGNEEFYGPFLVESPQRKYFQYFIKMVNPQQEFINFMFDSPWIMILLILLVSTPIILWLSYYIAKPVKELRLTANAVAMGDLNINPNLEHIGITEFREVGKSFNQMILALQQLTSYQQRLLSDISHELKTPLTRMQLAVSLLRRRNGDSNELLRIEGEIQKLDTMIHDLLTLSRKQANQHQERSIFAIHKIWDEVLENAKFEFEQNHLDLFVSQRIPNPDRYFINGNVTLLSSAVENVIRNAKKYAHSTVKMVSYVEKQQLHIIIDDDGAGIPDDQYQEIFRPFYRVEADRARQTGGTGLGLAIVANAVRLHQGAVSAEKSPLNGLRIHLQLPLWIDGV
ncbi:two-component system sensor histidine kinase CpxA [Pasteurellaceae bacterium Macca]|nr:two-component system sensor histidine kinase CpxA [Pasteurellaceae bacterium Macca]